MRQSKYDFPEGFRYYDEGWNARCRGESRSTFAAVDWLDGWLDCDEAPEEERKEIEE